MAAANLPGGADACYNTFYASLKQWGHYQLVSSPKYADLIFEISATKKAEVDKEILSPGPGPDKYDVTRYPAIITLAAKGASTGSILWTTQVGFLSTANTRNTEIKQFDETIEALTDRLKAMGPAASTAPAP